MAHLNSLTAISPLDGRYWSRVEDLVPFASEMALIKARTEVEARYLIALSEVGVVRALNEEERSTLEKIGVEMTMSQVERVKEIEQETRHDVKAVERAFREFVHGTSLEDVTEMIHFGLTSEDVNNLAQRLLLGRARKQIIIPVLDQLVDTLIKVARHHKHVPMLSRTHGQPAVPTTLGKEFANIAIRLNKQIRFLEVIPLTGKLAGAVGNFNALVLAYPDIDWIDFSQRFMSTLGLEANIFTTQINPYEDMIEVFHALQRINGILIDTDQDMWRYISDDWFTQEIKKGEVGSSTMPQKVNPIDFENSEGNLQLANSLLEGLSRKLAVSRLQRDLSDSTMSRNVGVALAHGLLAYRSTLIGLGRVHPNLEKISDQLKQNWTILGEGVQTVLRKTGVADPYTLIAGLSKGKQIGQKEWKKWVSGLPIDKSVKKNLEELTPESYVGYAERLTELALESIEHSRK